MYVRGRIIQCLIVIIVPNCDALAYVLLSMYTMLVYGMCYIVSTVARSLAVYV